MRTSYIGFRRHTLTSILAFVAASTAAAQQSDVNGRCSGAPGGAFGIRGYNCATCGFKYNVGQPAQYTFYAEPVVTDVEQGSQLVAGDVVVAVDNKPITTEAGASAFAYPGVGAHDLTIRRGREAQTIHVAVKTNCARAGGAHGDTVHVGVRVSSDQVPGPHVGKFGFGVECHPSCSMKRAADGRYYYKYDGYPTIAVIRPGSAAEMAHLRVGDEIVTVEGRSILGQDALAGTEDHGELHMTIRRDGKDIDVVLVVSKSD
jgi:hypothetical protein